jgi:hypothetical protein
MLFQLVLQLRSAGQSPNDQSLSQFRPFITKTLNTAPLFGPVRLPQMHADIESYIQSHELELGSELAKSVSDPRPPHILVSSFAENSAFLMNDIATS